MKTQAIHLKTTLKRTPQEAFAYFTDSKKLEDWLTRAAEVEPKVGGKYELFWNPSDRENDSTIGCRVTALEPGRLIAFDWKTQKEFKAFANAADPLTHVVIAFIPKGKGTEVHLIHTGWRASDEWRKAQEWQERAWRGALAGLRKKS